MVENDGPPTAALDDKRLTPIGRWLRRFKLDELLTLINFLKGDIALVGPRPDVPSEIESLNEETRDIVLSVKPGLISPATLWDINEDELLKGEPDPHKTYAEKIRPVKYELNKYYVNNKSFLYDIRIILATVFRLTGIKRDLFKVLPEWISAYDAIQKSGINERGA